MPTISLDDIVWTLEFNRQFTEHITFPVRVSLDWFAVRLWALLPNEWRAFYNLGASQSKVDGFWLFFWDIHTIQVLETLKKALADGEITQAEFDEAYPNPDNPLE